MTVKEFTDKNAMSKKFIALVLAAFAVFMYASVLIKFS